MYHFAKKDILCLCIHDSFIVEDIYREELKDVMKKYYKDEMVIRAFKQTTMDNNSSNPNLHIDEYTNSLPNDAFDIKVA